MAGIQSLMVETGSETRWTFPGNTPKKSSNGHQLRIETIHRWPLGSEKKEKKQENPLEKYEFHISTINIHKPWLHQIRSIHQLSQKNSMEKSPLNFLKRQKSPWLPMFFSPMAKNPRLVIPRPRPCRAPQPPPSLFFGRSRIIIPLDVGNLRIRPFFRKKNKWFIQSMVILWL